MEKNAIRKVLMYSEKCEALYEVDGQFETMFNSKRENRQDSIKSITLDEYNALVKKYGEKLKTGLNSREVIGFQNSLNKVIEEITVLSHKKLEMAI